MLEQYYPTILNILLNRLQNTKTESFALRFVRLYHFISAKDEIGLGADFFISKLDQVQEGYALMRGFPLIEFLTADLHDLVSLFPCTSVSSFQIRRNFYDPWIERRR